MDESHDWTPEQETILKIWAEKAAGYRFLHNYTANMFRKLNERLGLSSLFLVTLAGVGGLSDLQCSGSGVVYITGFMSLIAAFLSAVQKFMRTAEKTETHDNLANQFAEYYRHIAVELMLAPHHRTKCKEVAKYCRTEYNRMVRVNAPVPNRAIKEFKARFPDVQNKPDIANGLTEVKIYDRPSTLHKIVKKITRQNV